MSYVSTRAAKSAGTLLFGLITTTALFSPHMAWAQQTASVTVNAGTSLGTIPAQSLGVNTAVWDGALRDASVPGLVSQAGINMLRYPGGSTSDVYHWQNNTGTAGAGVYTDPNNTFDNFMTVAHNASAGAIITCNYGSNAAGTAGGDPAEAAAWVQYANVTKGYGVKYWEVGNEIYGNGEYGGGWETDKHADHSPTAYGTNVVSFVNAMKAQDATIKVGAVLCAPGNWPDGQAPDWNTNVLTQCGSKIDFVIVHWYPQSPGSENDATLLGTPSQIASMVSRLRTLINQYCGANAPNVQILVTETNSVSSNPGKQSVSLVNALFASDDVMSWLENGVTSVDWWALHNGSSAGNTSASLYGTATYGDYGILSNGSSGEPASDTPFSTYYGLQMLKFLGKPGDTMVSATSNQALVAAHAVKQAGGGLSLLLVNKDPANSRAVTVTVSGYTPAATGTVYSYGQGSTAIASTGSSTLGSSFTVTVPAYSLTTIAMSAGTAPPPPTAPAFTSSTTVTPASVAAGGTATIKSTLTDTGGALTNGIVDLEVYNSAGTKISQQAFTAQNFAAGAAQSYSWTWTAPTTTGTYTVKVGVFDLTWATNYYWNASASTITVTAPVPSDTAQYNFETGTQSWTGSGGMITGVASSTAKAFAGTSSLAVSMAATKADTQQVSIGAPSTPAGKTVTFHVWFPSGSTLTAIQPYVQQGASGNWLWTGTYKTTSTLTPNAWNTITVVVPANAVTPLSVMGVQFVTSGPWSGTCYVDSVGW